MASIGAAGTSDTVMRAGRTALTSTLTRAGIVRAGRTVAAGGGTCGTVRADAAHHLAAIASAGIPCLTPGTHLGASQTVGIRILRLSTR